MVKRKIMNGKNSLSMNRHLIYTALIGEKYDNLMTLSAIDERFDYICFVRKGDKQCDYVGNWRIVELECVSEDNVRLSRYPKLVPHKTEVAKYEYSIYIDANINITGEDIYNRFFELVEKDVHIALLKHPFRDCVYQEAYVCIAALKGGWFDIIRQIVSLRMSGVKSHLGLYEANFIFRKQNSPEIVKLGELWWKTFKKYSKRDQLSLIYSLHKTNIIPNYFLEPGYTTRNHPSLEKVQHNKQVSSAKDCFKRRVVSILYCIFKPLLKEDLEK